MLSTQNIVKYISLLVVFAISLIFHYNENKMVKNCLQGFSITFFILLSLGLLLEGFYLNLIYQEIAFALVRLAYPSCLFWASLALVDGALALYFQLAKEKYTKGIASLIILLLVIAEFITAYLVYPHFPGAAFFYGYVLIMAMLNVVYINSIEKSGKGKYNLPVFGALKSYLYVLAPLSMFILAILLICLYIALLVASCLCYCIGGTCSTTETISFKKTFWGDYYIYID